MVHKLIVSSLAALVYAIIGDALCWVLLGSWEG